MQNKLKKKKREIIHFNKISGEIINIIPNFYFQLNFLFAILNAFS